MPVEVAAARVGDDVEIRVTTGGVPLAAAAAWPRSRRTALAVQVVAAATFLFERGWLPGRRLLRGARVEPGTGGDRLRLAALPSVRLDEPGFEQRLRARPRLSAELLAHALRPVLAVLVPERLEACEASRARRPGWEAGSALLEALLAGSRPTSALRHPDGPGRALWARRFAVRGGGAVAVGEETLVPALVNAACLAAAAAGRALDTASGAFEEEELARRGARAAAEGRDLLLLTTVGIPGVPGIALASGEAAVWLLAPAASLLPPFAEAAAELGAERPAAVAELLGAGAATAFAASPGAIPRPDRASLASAPARRALGWLGQLPVGLTRAEVAVLAGVGGRELAELERLGLAHCRHDRLTALLADPQVDHERLATIASRLPGDSLSAVVARAMARGTHEALATWCDAALERGDAGEVRRLARAFPAVGTVALRGAEASLLAGRLAEAERFLEGVPGSAREARWHALAAWWADQAGLPSRAEDALVAAEGSPLPARLAARVAMVRAERARRQRDRDGERRLLDEAVALAPDAAWEAALARAAADGHAAVRMWRRSLGSAWCGDVAARTLHLLGMLAFERCAWAAAGTALRAALRAASGENPRLLGEIHADLGGLGVILDRPGQAERNLLLAEQLLERCGSRRAVTIVRANRGVLACDRLLWREARELILASRRLRGGVEDAAHWVEEAELVRADLARGDVDATRAGVERLAAAAERFPGHTILQQSLAALRGQLALAVGDLAAAAQAAAGADEAERDLLLAIVGADQGTPPGGSLPQRWGLAVTAAALAALRSGDEAGGLAAVERALAHEAAAGGVAMARLSAIVAARGGRLDERWVHTIERAEEALETAGLDGWADSLRQSTGRAVARLLRALDGALNGGALSEPRLAALGRALGLGGLQVAVRGAAVAGWGETGSAAVTRGDVELHATGPLDETGRAALELLAGALASTVLPGGEPPIGPTPSLLGGSAAMDNVRVLIARWGPLPVTVLVQGEPGTGKELIARELHRASGRRGAFVPVNCAGIPSTLLEAELFGVVRGAFTGADRDRMGLVETAEGGTLFLDEVGELPVELQGKLLRLLQEREVRRVGATRARTVDVRFIAATNRDLTAAVSEGSFRQDLYYRLAVAVVTAPPLRDRPDDVEALAARFVARYAVEFGRHGVRLGSAGLTALRRGSWPGNVRELDSVVQRAVASARPGETLGPSHFPGLDPVARPPGGDEASCGVEQWSVAVEGFRRSYFLRLLAACDGNRSEGARRAGLSRQALLYHLRGLGINPRKT
jgi:transcriptional regulator with AAA-type ATPase domain